MRRFMAVGAIATVLALGGCGGGDDHGAPRTPSTTPASGPAGGPTATTGTPVDPPSDPASAGVLAGKLAGTWIGQTDGGVVTLAVKGVQAALIADGHVCQGTIQDRGVPTLVMTCVDGNTDRATGVVRSNDGHTAVIAWGTTKQDTLKRTPAPPSTTPSGPPSAHPVLPSLPASKG